MHLAYPASLQALHSDNQKWLIQIQHKKIKNPNWQEAFSWLFTSVANRGFKLGSTREQIQQVAREGFESRIASQRRRSLTLFASL